MKVKCIDNSTIDNLTLNKEYDVKEHYVDGFGDSCYRVIKDDGLIGGYYQRRFEIVPDRKPGEFFVGDTVRLIANTNSSINRIGDRGIVIEASISPSRGYKIYRVKVEGSRNENSSSNWSIFDEIELVKEGTGTIKPVEIVKPTDEEFLKSIDVTLYSNRINIKALNSKGTIATWSSQYNISASNISCGVKELNGLNETFGAHLRDWFNTVGYSHLYTDELQLELLKKGFKLLFEGYKSAGFLLMSTNIDNNPDFIKIAKTIESFDFVSWSDTYNRNSNNNIRMWFIDLYKYQNR